MPSDLREVIPILKRMNDLNMSVFPIESTTPKATCKAFKDNNGKLEMKKVHNHRSRTKHLIVKLHHFRDYMNHGEVTILPI